MTRQADESFYPKYSKMHGTYACADDDAAGSPAGDDERRR